MRKAHDECKKELDKRFRSSPQDQALSQLVVVLFQKIREYRKTRNNEQLARKIIREHAKSHPKLDVVTGSHVKMFYSPREVLTEYAKNFCVPREIIL